MGNSGYICSEKVSTKTQFFYYAASMVFYTDGYLIDGCAGFAFHRTGEGVGYKISSPAGIFTAELTTLFVTLRHIGEVIQLPEKCLILTDSLSSVKALLSRKISHRIHPLVCECKQMFSDLGSQWCNGLRHAFNISPLRSQVQSPVLALICI
jgi:hypothetical protein